MRFDDKSVRRENGKHMVGCCDALQVQPKTKPFKFKHIDARTEFRVLEYLNQKLAISGFSISRGRLPGNGKEIEIIGVIEV
jgi:hypothetical protein